MPTAIESAPVSKKSLRAGYIVSALCALFLVFDSVGHLVVPAPVAEAFARLGFPLSLAVPLGIIEFACLAVYVFPRTSILGAILLTGYLGGAVALHVRVADPLFDTLFPIIFGALAWGGLFLRDGRLRTFAKEI